MKHIKLFENFSESDDARLPGSITIKVNGSKFSNTWRWSEGQDRSLGAYYSGNYSRLANREDGLHLENGQLYPMLELKRGYDFDRSTGKRKEVFNWLYIVFDNEMSEFRSRGGGIRLIETRTPWEKISSESFGYFVGPVRAHENLIWDGIGYSENCFFKEFTPGTVDDRGYFEIVKVN